MPEQPLTGRLTIGPQIIESPGNKAGTRDPTLLLWIVSSVFRQVVIGPRQDATRVAPTLSIQDGSELSDKLEGYGSRLEAIEVNHPLIIPVLTVDDNGHTPRVPSQVPVRVLIREIIDQEIGVAADCCDVEVVSRVVVRRVVRSMHMGKPEH